MSSEAPGLGDIILLTKVLGADPINQISNYHRLSKKTGKPLLVKREFSFVEMFLYSLVTLNGWERKQARFAHVSPSGAWDVSSNSASILTPLLPFLIGMRNQSVHFPVLEIIGSRCSSAYFWLLTAQKYCNISENT